LPIARHGGKIGNREEEQRNIEEETMTVSYEELKRRLEDQQTRLIEEIKLFQIDGCDNLGYGNHQADDATDAFEQTKELSLLQNSKRLLAQVQAALARFEQGTYGLCERCGQEIDPARLHALPYVALCMVCQQRLEQA
jgi:DnaK suppressor protein